MVLIAYCYASGEIQFGSQIPAGAIEIARGAASIVRREIANTSRLARDNETLLVPGVPEASNQKRAGDALELHLLWLKQRDRTGFRVAIKPRDPFMVNIVGKECLLLCVHDRLQALERFSLLECMAALLVEPLQKTVRTAIERRMRKLVSMSMRVCRECGCTDDYACEGGCYWVEPDLCSACTAKDAQS